MKRYIRSSETSSKSTDPQSEYEYRKHIYLKRKHEFETLGEDDNNDVLSREEKMNIAKAEMDKVNPKSVKSAKDATFKINEIKASEAVSDDDNYNPYSFMVGDQLEWSGLYGGEYKGVVTNVTDEYITVDVMWTAEDTGDTIIDTQRFEIATDPEGRECIIVYRYRDTAGYVYPPSNSRSSKDATFKTDKRLSPTSERYKGYLIVLDRGGDGYNVYDKHRELEDAGYPSRKAAKEFIDSLLVEDDQFISSASYGGAFDIEDNQYSAWRELASKSVEDSDGFYTDYTLYTDGQTYICMFGDKNLYEPDASYADYETESEQDAWDWFNSYTGFADEEDEEYEYYDILESTQAINSSQYPYRQNDINDKLDTLYDRACATFGEDLVNKIVVECGGPTPGENPDSWWSDSLDTEKFYHKLTELFLNNMLNYEDFEDASDMDMFAYNCVAEEYDLPTVEDLDSPGYVYDPQKVWEQFRNKITNISSTTGVYYPNGKEVTDIDLDTYLDYNFGTDRDKDNSKYTTEEKQRSVDYWFKKHDTIRGSESTEAINSGYSPDLLNDLVNYYRSFDTMSSEEIWDEIVAEYNNEDLANDVLESLDDYDEEGAYDVYSSSDIKASMGRYDEYYGQTAAATYGDLIADRLKGKSVSKRRDTANEPGGLIYEADKLGIDMWDLLEALEGMCNEGRAREMDDSTYKILGACCDVYSSEDFDDYEDDLDHPDQEYDSAATSINSTKLPAIYRMIKLQPGTVGVDFGGGKFNNAIDYLRDQDVTLCVYDPYNRSAEHNKEVLRTLRANGGADFAINSNVLNVIKEPEARKGVLENIKKITKPGAPIYITVYEGRGDAKEGVTKSGYQLNRKTADYLEEIQEVFPDAKRRGKLIVATNKGSANSSVDIKASSEIIWDDLDWNEQIQVMKRYIRNYKGTRIFEDFADYINKPVEDIIDSFTDAESHEDIKIPERMQLDSEYRNDDIYSSSSVDANTDEYSRVDASSRTVNSSTNIKASSTEGYVYTYCDECGKKNRVKVAFNSFNEPFNDTEYKCKYCGTNNLLTDPHSYDENGNVVEASQSFLDRIEELMEQGLDEDTASREAYAEFYPDEYDADDYDEIYSANYGGAYYVEVNSTQRGTAPYEKKFSDFNSALSFAKKRGNSKTTIYIWDIPKEERSSNSVPNAVYNFDSGWQIIRPVNANEDRADDEIYSSTTSSSRYWYFTRHGVQPGSVPKYVNILDIVDTPEGSYFLTDGVILTDDLRNYEIKERKPKNDVVEASKSTKGETVEAGYYDMPEPPIDPPEDDSWTEVDGWIEDVDLDVDAIIEVLDDGSWIYEDETYPWAVSKDSYNGDHYSYEYYVHIGDPGTIVEDFDDVIEKYIPSEEGRYHLKCKATLKYFIEGVEVKQSYYNDEEVYKDNASVEFDEYDSKVENVSVERIW